ncbi:putative SP-containing membrane protein [Vairimorpha necatrix]|uniref:SP-containing membrane protein n=1 Tax=Vairimorpha necatrix TaxID=6039 RepID=A0AAX4JCD4_9MICR
MKLKYFSIQILIYTFGIIKAGNNVTENLHDMMNSNLNKSQICNSLHNNVGDNGLSSNAVLDFGFLFWDAITNHDIFKNMTQNITSPESFNFLHLILKVYYIEKIKEVFRLKKWNPELLDGISSTVRNFTYEFVDGTLDAYNMLRLCFKDTINDSNSTKESIERILKENTCFIPKGISETIPSFVIKMCAGIRPYYNECYGNRSTLLFLEDVRKNHDQIYRAECSNDIYDFKNMNTKDLRLEDNVKFSYLNMLEAKNNGYIFNLSPNLCVGIIIICLMFTFCGYLYYKKCIKKRSDQYKAYDSMEKERVEV